MPPPFTDSATRARWKGPTLRGGVLDPSLEGVHAVGGGRSFDRARRPWKASPRVAKSSGPRPQMYCDLPVAGRVIP